MSRREPSSRTGSLMAEIRRMPLFRQVVPMESGIGWPVQVRHRPGWDGDIAVYLKLPLFGFQRPRDTGQPTQVYPPFALITLEWGTEFVERFLGMGPSVLDS